MRSRRAPAWQWPFTLISMNFFCEREDCCHQSDTGSRNVPLLFFRKADFFCGYRFLTRWFSLPPIKPTDAVTKRWCAGGHGRCSAGTVRRRRPRGCFGIVAAWHVRQNLDCAWPALFTALHCGSKAVSFRRRIWASSHARSFRSDRLIASRLVCSLRLCRYAEQDSCKCQSNRNDFHLCPSVRSSPLASAPCG